MKNRYAKSVKIIVAVLISLLIIMNCKVISLATPTPLPGWDSPVYQLLVEDSQLPPGWIVDPAESPESEDPTTNHVVRSWYYPDSSRGAFQSIWRAKNVKEAIEKYDELHSTQFDPLREPYQGTVYKKFEPPIEITFTSVVADDHYFACGWLSTARCVLIARYRNYVIEIDTDLQAELNDVVSEGMTYNEIGSLITNADMKFVEFINNLDSTTSSP